MANSHPCVNFSIVQTRRVLLGTIPPAFDCFLSAVVVTPSSEHPNPKPKSKALTLISHFVVLFPTTDPLGTTHQVPLGRHGHTFTCWGNAQGVVIYTCPLHSFRHYTVGGKGQITSFSIFESYLAIVVAIND